MSDILMLHMHIHVFYVLRYIFTSVIFLHNVQALNKIHRPLIKRLKSLLSAVLSMMFLNKEMLFFLVTCDLVTFILKLASIDFVATGGIVFHKHMYFLLCLQFFFVYKGGSIV